MHPRALVATVSSGLIQCKNDGFKERKNIYI